MKSERETREISERREKTKSFFSRVSRSLFIPQTHNPLAPGKFKDLEIFSNLPNPHLLMTVLS